MFFCLVLKKPNYELRQRPWFAPWDKGRFKKTTRQLYVSLVGGWTNPFEVYDRQVGLNIERNGNHQPPARFFYICDFYSLTTL